MNWQKDYRTFIRILLLLNLSLVSYYSTAEIKHSHHVNNVEPSSDINIPNNWPLKNNRLDCITCHGDKNIAEKKPENIDSKATNFLHNGSYTNLQLFCQNCHQKDDYQASNIHQILDRKGEIKKGNCLYCHDKRPERDDKKREQLSQENQAKLRLSKDKICYGCHLKTPHLNALEHQVKVDKKIAKQIKNTELAKNISIPLGNNQQVICISCHTPHQRGVLDVNSPKGKQVANSDLVRGNHYQTHAWNKIVQRDKKDRLTALAPEFADTFKYQQIKHEVLLRLPAKNGELCLACHTFSR